MPTISSLFTLLVRTEITVPEIANEVPHLRVTWDHDKLGVTPEQVHKRMSEGEPRIELHPEAKEAITVGVDQVFAAEQQARRLRSTQAFPAREGRQVETHFRESEEIVDRRNVGGGIDQRGRAQ